MGTTAAVHPTDQTLQAYGLGKLDDPTAEPVNRHLESCLDCQRRVAELSSDSFLGRLQGVRGQLDTGPAMSSSLAGLSRIAGEANSVEPPPASSLPPGLADHADYEVIRELGQGGMGTVYLAQNRLMGRYEVLKVVSSHLIKRRGVLERFQVEIRNAGRLHHTNIVTAYAASRVGESIIFAMEYVEGLDLSKLVKAKGPLPVANACNYVHQACLGLQHAHEHDMVHRDIKPSNLMLTRQGKRAVIKVLDFGLAKIQSEGAVDSGLTHEGQMLGTPDYVAPEQTIDARKADIRADIYSLGCTLYYLLTGGPPFQAASLYELLQAHHSMDALPLNLARPEVPVEVAAIVAKMMAKEPERRFQQPKEVAHALQPFFKNGAVGAVASIAEMSQAGAMDERQTSTTARSVSIQPAPGMTPVPMSPIKTLVATGRPEAMWESLIDTGEKERVADQAPGVAATKQRARWSSRPVLVTASVLGMLLFGVVIYVATNKGRIKIEVSDLDVVVTIDDGKTFSIEGLDAPMTLSVGDHDLEVKRGDLVVMSRSFSVHRGENEPLRIGFEPKAIGMSGGMMGPMMAGGESKDSAPTGSGMGGMMGRMMAGGGSKDSAPKGPGMGGMMGGGMMGGSSKDSAPTGSGMGGMMGRMMAGGGSKDSAPKGPGMGGMMAGMGGMMGGGSKDSAPKGPGMGGMMGGGMMGGSSKDSAPTGSGMGGMMGRMMAGGGSKDSAPKGPGMGGMMAGMGGMMGGGSKDSAPKGPGMGGMMGGGMMGGSSKDSAPTGSGMGGMMGRMMAGGGSKDSAPKGPGMGGMMAGMGGMMGGGSKDSAPKGPGMGGMMGGGMMGGSSKDSTPAGSTMGGMMAGMGGMMGGGMMGGSMGMQAAPRQDGFVVLFNGVDLTEWKDILINGSEWTVVDGILEGHGGGGRGQPAVLLTDRRNFTNFQLRVKARYPNNGAGRIEIRHTGADENMSGYHVAQGAYVDGGQIPVGSIGMSLDSRYGGRIGWNHKAEAFPISADEWHTVEISAIGSRISTMVNGRIVLDFVDPARAYTSGGIAMICGYNSQVQIQEILIRELPDENERKETASRKSTKNRVADALQPGTVWEGTWTFEDPGYSGRVASYKLIITESFGNRFKAESDYQFDTFHMRSAVEGTIQGDRIEYDEVGQEKWRFSSQGTIVGNEISCRFQGTGSGENARFGKGQMKLQEKK